MNCLFAIFNNYVISSIINLLRKIKCQKFTISSENRIIPKLVKNSVLRKYTSVKQLSVRQHFNCYIYLRMEQIQEKCIMSLVFAYKMLSNHVPKCETNFLNILYINGARRFLADVVPCGGSKKSPRTLSIVQIIFVSFDPLRSVKIFGPNFLECFYCFQMI